MARPSPDRLGTRGVFRARLARRNADEAFPRWRDQERDRNAGGGQDARDDAPRPAESESANRTLTGSSADVFDEGFEACDLKTISASKAALTDRRPRGPSLSTSISNVSTSSPTGAPTRLRRPCRYRIRERWLALRRLSPYSGDRFGHETKSRARRSPPAGFLREERASDHAPARNRASASS
jgi:hypothetical protein